MSNSLSQTKLAELLGCSRDEVADRIAGIREYCEALDMACPVEEVQGVGGEVYYTIEAEKAATLSRLATTN